VIVLEESYLMEKDGGKQAIKWEGKREDSRTEGGGSYKQATKWRGKREGSRRKKVRSRGQRRVYGQQSWNDCHETRDIGYGAVPAVPYRPLDESFRTSPLDGAFYD